MGSKYSLESWEVALIKGLLLRGGRSHQQILAYFTRPGRDINHNVIPAVLHEYVFRHIPPADDSLLDLFLQFRAAQDPHFVAQVRSAIAAAGRGVFEFGYRLFPVGQGLFSSGWVSRHNNEPFRWVYDCGTSNEKRRRLVLRGLASLRAETRAFGRRDHIDLFTVSHFDQDHVSGLKALLRYFSVGTLVLPYLAPWDRLLVALGEDAAAGSDLLAFLLAPTAFILGLPGVEVERIILVPPGEGPASAPIPRPTDDGPHGPDVDILDLKIDCADTPEEADQGAIQDVGLTDARVKILRPGGALTIPYLWEFVPYNDPACAALATRAFRDSARPLVAVLRTSPNEADRSQALEDLKALYEETFGSTPKQKNIISLFQYCGPIGSTILLRAEETAFHNRFLNWGISDLRGVGDDRFGLMMTGDGYLRTKVQLASFNRFYRPHGRLKRAGCFQVMHHGSKSNWQPGIAAKIKPNVSLFSSHPTGEYRHPHAEVFRDFAPFAPRQIDRTVGWAVEAQFIFT